MAPRPEYNPFLAFAPTFRWGGRAWGANDKAAFEKYLRARGVNPERWYRRHGTAAKVFSPTDQLLYSQFQPQFRAIQEQQRQQQDFYRRQLVDIGGFMHQLMGTLGEVAPAIRDAYMQGSNAMGALGTGYGDILNTQGAENAAAGNVTLDAIGAPQGQQLQGGDAGGVLAGLAGWIPQTLLSQQGGAYADAAATLPASASLEAQIMAKNVLEQARQANADYQGQISDLISQIPSIRQQILDVQYQRGQQSFENKLAMMKFEADQHYKRAALAMKRKDYKLAERETRLAEQKEQRYALEAQGRAPDGSPMPGYYEDVNGNILPKGYRYNKKGEIVKIGDKEADKKAPDWGAINVQMAEDVDGFYDEVEGPYGGASTKTQWSWQKAYNHLLSKYAPLVKNKAKLRKMIEVLLRRRGFKKGNDAADRQNPYG